MVGPYQAKVRVKRPKQHFRADNTGQRTKTQDEYGSPTTQIEIYDFERNAKRVSLAPSHVFSKKFNNELIRTVEKPN